MTAMTTTRLPIPSRQRGMGIVEVMVGILIGMIVVAAIYNVFAVAEGYKRTAVGAAEAQTTGVYAQFVLRAGDRQCRHRAVRRRRRAFHVHGGGPRLARPAPASAADYIRPIPVLIRDGGAANVSDSFLVTYSTSPRVDHADAVHRQADGRRR